MFLRSMRSVLFIRIGVPLACLLILGFLGEKVQAEAPEKASPGAMTATVEVVQSGPRQKDRLLRASIGVVAGARPTRVTLDEGQARCHLGLNVERVEQGLALIHLDLHWMDEERPRGQADPSQASRPARRKADLSTTSKVSLGRKVQVGSFDLTDGGRLALFVTLGPT